MEKKPVIRLYGTLKNSKNTDPNFVILRIEDSKSYYSIKVVKKMGEEGFSFVPSIAKIDKKLKIKFKFSEPSLREDEICHSCINFLTNLFDREFKIKRVLLDKDQVWKNGHLKLEGDEEYGDSYSVFTDLGIIWKSTTKVDKRSQPENKLRGKDVISLHSITYNDWDTLKNLITQPEDYGRCFNKSFFNCKENCGIYLDKLSEEGWIYFPPDMGSL